MECRLDDLDERVTALDRGRVRIAEKFISIRRGKSARRVLPIRTQTTGGPVSSSLRTTKSSSLVMMTAPTPAA